MTLFENPEFLRLARTKLRPKSLVTYGAAGVAMFGGILLLMYWGWQVSVGRPPFSVLLQTYFNIAIGIQLAIVGIYGLMLAAQNITMEREKYTYDFQRLVAMGPWKLALGKLLGCALEAFYLAGIGMLFAALPMFYDVVTPRLFIETQIVVFLFGITIVSVGLTCSSLVEKTAKSTGLAFLVIFVLVSMIGATVDAWRTGLNVWNVSNPVAMLVFLARQPLSSPTMSFFVRETIPAIAGFIIVNGAVALLFFVVTARRLRDEEISFISPTQALIAFAVLQTLLVGDFTSSKGYSSDSALKVFNGVNLFALLALAFGLTPGAELLRGRINRAVRDEHWKLLRERDNIREDSPAIQTMLMLAAGYAALAIMLTGIHATGPDALSFWLCIPMVAGIGIATASMLLYIQVYTVYGGFRIAVLVVVVAMTIPAMVAGIAGNADTDLQPAIIIANPIAYIGFMGERLFNYRGTPINNGHIVSLPLICVVLAVAFTVLSAMRIRYLLDVKAIAERRKEQHSETVQP